jgi:hypothetical protein
MDGNAMLLDPFPRSLTLIYVQACFDHDVCLDKYAAAAVTLGDADFVECPLYEEVWKGTVCWCEQQLINAANAVPKKDCSWYEVSELQNVVVESCSTFQCYTHAVRVQG